MAKKAKKKTDKGLKLEIVNPNATGIDVSSTGMQVCVCVPQNRDDEDNRRFGTFTEDLYLIGDRLSACGIDTVAMESTGVYWVQLYMIS